MNYFNKKNLVILSIVVLLIVNIAAISTIVYLSYRKPPIPPPQMDLPEVRTPALRESLKFTPEQREKYNALDKNYKENTRALFMGLHQNRIKMMDEFSKPNPDSSVLYDLAEETGRLHQQLKRQTINHLLDIKSFCTEKQFKYLERRFRSRIMEDEPGRRFHHGRKGKNRKQRSNRN